MPPKVLYEGVERRYKLGYSTEVVWRSRGAFKVL